MSAAKLGYLWSGLAQQYFAMTNWDTAYPIDLPPNTSQPLPFSETGYFTLDFKSRYAYTDSTFGTPGSIVVNDRRAFGTTVLGPNPNGDSWFHVERKGGWWLQTRPGTSPPQYMSDPRGTQRRRQQQRCLRRHDGVGRATPYTVTADPTIGILPVTDSRGNPTLQTAYFVQLVIFAGVNRNVDPPSPLLAKQNSPNDVIVPNPYTGFDPTADSAPAPIDLDHTLVTTSPDARRQYLTFLAVAHQGDTSFLWPSRFATGQPYPNIVAVAQAKVFNDHSWDLWTQMWHAQLEPVTGLDPWLTQMDGGSPEYQYLQSIPPLAPAMMSH